jgi:hypothetical protein
MSLFYLQHYSNVVGNKCKKEMQRREQNNTGFCAAEYGDRWVANFASVSQCGPIRCTQKHFNYSYGTLCAVAQPSPQRSGHAWHFICLDHFNSKMLRCGVILFEDEYQKTASQ